MARQSGGSDDPYLRAVGLQRVINSAIRSFGSGPFGLALFGAISEATTDLSKDRRQTAAIELDIFASTFRKNYEVAVPMSSLFRSGSISTITRSHLIEP